MRTTQWWYKPQLLIISMVALLALASYQDGLSQRLQSFIKPSTKLNVRDEQIPPLQRLGARPKSAASLQPPNCNVLPCLALTFDDGPNPITTPQVLDILEQAQVPATFFVMGYRAAAMPALLQRMYIDGDEIGNHSWNHPDFTKLSADQIFAQFTQTQAAVIRAGAPAPTLFRPPYGAVNDLVKRVIPVSLILWSEDPADWQTQDPAKIIPSVESQARAGGIVDMHDIYPSTVAALPQLLSDLKGHFQLVTVSQLLSLNRGARGQYFAR